MDDTPGNETPQSKETLQFSQFAMDNASVEIYWLGGDARIHYVNSQACKTLGYSKEELLQLSIPDLDPLFPIEQWNKHWESLKNDRTQTFTTQHRRKNGEVFEVEVIANYVKFGTLEYNVAYARDITERKQVEESIRKSDQRSKELISNLQVGVIIQSQRSEIISNNQLALDLLGLNEDQLLGKTSFDPDWNVIHEDGTPFPGNTHPVPQAIETRKSVNNVVMGVYRPLDENRVWLLVSAVPQLNADGSVEQVVCTFVDYTERKRSDDILKASEEKYRALVETTNTGYLIIDNEGKVVDANLEYVRLTGYSKLQDIIGRRVTEWTASYERDKNARAVEQCVRDGFIKNLSIDYVDLNERITPVEVNATVLGNGSSLRIISLCRDISERRKMEDKIRQLAFFDPLTGLPNRRLLDDRLAQTIAACKRSNCYAALMFLDLDNFKPLNDTHGHVVGDMLLVDAANRLRNCVREMDTVARFGGDEFVVILSELEVDKTAATTQARLVADKIRATLSAPYLLEVGHDGKPSSTIEHRCTASIGVAMFINHEGSQDTILKCADTAMYQSKEAERNSIRFYEPKTSTTSNNS
jgi:diguanylate cyclase (GGDEF)-like protein/PAS domain S-box-containing protein